MLSFLFWNLQGEQRPERHATLRDHLARMAQSLDIDLFLFVEPISDGPDVAKTLSTDGGSKYRDVPSESTRVQVITRLPRRTVVNQYDSVDGRMTVRRLRLPGGELLLAALHFQSQLHWTPVEQTLQATVIHAEIARAEEAAGHYRTVLVGDLNMNPFDAGLVGAQALNAVMTKHLARRGVRQVAGKDYRFFYNPMWGHFGDRTPGPAGTYYHAAGGPASCYWQMFDQVLLRPDLIDALAELRILETDGVEPLLTSHGHPRTATASDHLPLLFRLNLRS